MVVHVRQPHVTEGVCSFLARLGYAAHAITDCVLVVDPPEGIPEYAARIELGVYLRLWRIANEPGDAVLRP